MDKLRSLFYIGFCYPAQGFFAVFFIPCPDMVANHNVLNGFPALVQQNYCSGSKAEPIPLELQPYQGLLRPGKSILLLSIISCCPQKSTSYD